MMIKDFVFALLAAISYTFGFTLYAQEQVVLGDQRWMKANLNSGQFRNGDVIPYAATDSEWLAASESRSPAWCYYQNNPANEPKYGRLYNGYAVQDERGICPSGWQVPDKTEWLRLWRFLLGDMRQSDWLDDKSGSASGVFLGLNNAGRLPSGLFLSPGKNGGWWTSGPQPADTKGLFFILSVDSESALIPYVKGSGFSVRCIQERINETKTVTDNSVPDEATHTGEVLRVVEETATPQGGMAAFYRHIGSSLRYPAEATRLGVEGKVFVEFVINRDGTVSDAHVVRSIGAGCDEEAVRIVMSSPPWNPGKQRGKPVRQLYTLPVQFKLQ